MAKKPKPKPRSAAKVAKDTPQPVVPAEAVFVNSLFKTVLLSLISIGAVLLVIAVVVAFISVPNEMQKQLFTSASHGCELIIGAVVGLISGKGIDAFAYRTNPPPPS